MSLALAADPSAREKSRKHLRVTRHLIPTLAAALDDSRRYRKAMFVDLAGRSAFYSLTTLMQLWKLVKRTKRNSLYVLINAVKQLLKCGTLVENDQYWVVSSQCHLSHSSKLCYL